MPATRRTVRSSLALLALACMLPGALLSTYFIVSNYQTQRERMISEAVSATHSLVAALDRDLTNSESSLRMLAGAPMLKAGDLPSFYQRAHSALPLEHASNYVLLDDSFRQVMNTQIPWGAHPPSEPIPPQLQQVFQGSAPVITDLSSSSLAREPIYAIGVPVTREGKSSYALVAGFRPERITTLLLSQHLPKGWIAAVLDGQGILVGRTHETARFVGHPAASALVRAASLASEGRLETETLEGIPVLTVFSRSKVSTWTVAIGIPKAALTENLKYSFAGLAAGGALMFAATLLLAWRLALNRVVAPADRLLERMVRLSHDQDPEPQANTGATREFAALELGFQQMAMRLRKRDQERDILIRRLTSTLESMNDGFYLLDHQWCFAYINQHAEKLLRCDRKIMLGQSHWAVVNEAEAGLMKSKYQQAISEHQSVSFDIRLPSLDLWLEVTASPNELGLSVYFRDVATLRLAQQARDALSAAQAANQAKNEFVSRMSHELRTPLNAVLGFAQLLRMDGKATLNEKQLGMVERIEKAGLHLLEMIHDVLDLSSLEFGAAPLTIKPVDVRAIVGNCAQMMGAGAATAGVTIKTVIGDNVAFVDADATGLNQVLLNLLSNAVKYNRPGGQVILTAECSGQRTRFSVKDNGLGMTPAQLAHLFEPFNRLGRENDQTPGTGIGLVICKKMVKLMGGDLEVSAQEGIGSVFTFVLLNAAPSTPSQSTPQNSAPEINGYGPRKVLCVEDNPINRELIAATLAYRPQVRLSEVSTVQGAIERLQAESFDLILLDMQLPDGSGLDVLSWLGTNRPVQIPVLVMSANATVESSAAAVQAGAVRYLRKPLDVGLTLEVIDSLLSVAKAQDSPQPASSAATA